MIYYFSGTGNSRYIATVLAGKLDENIKFIPATEAQNESPEGESIGFVFPVYSWGVPIPVRSFIKSLSEKYISEIRKGEKYVWCVMTCGDETALAPEMFLNDCKKEGLPCCSVMGVIMPNDYVLLPGFDVDSKTLEKDKIEKSLARIEELAEKIKSKWSGIDVVRGNMPWAKTKLIYPLFKRWGVFPKKWHATEKCIGCGKCSDVCPEHNIKMIEKNNSKHPYWGACCCSCLACYHICPVNAVQYGKMTKGKGQYYFKRNL